MGKGRHLEYKSSNGYTGLLYGKSSLSIYDADDNEVMHTGSRSINTFKELVKFVDEFPAKRKKLDEEFERIWSAEEDIDDIS